MQVLGYLPESRLAQKYQTVFLAPSGQSLTFTQPNLKNIPKATNKIKRIPLHHFLSMIRFFVVVFKKKFYIHEFM